MKNEDKIKEQLINELSELRKQAAELETSEIRRKQVEEELRESELKYRILFESSQDAIMILDKKGFFDCNKATLKIFGGLSKEEFVLKHPSELSPPKQPNGNDSFAASNKSIEKALTEGSNFFEWMHKRADGTIFPAEVLLSRIELGGREVLQALVRDVSERKRAEEKLRESEKRLKVKLDYILSPEEGVEKVTLLNLIDLENLQQIQDSFAEATSLAILVTDQNGNPITKPSNFSRACKIIRSTEKGSERCMKSDKIIGEKAAKLLIPVYHECLSCGFASGSAPIIVAGEHIANWLIGQGNLMNVDRRRIEEYANEIGADVDEMLEAYDNMPRIPLKKYEQALELSGHFAKELSTLGYNNLKLARDITERKRVDEKLRFQATLLDQIGDHVTATDLTGRITYVNAVGCRIMGRTREKLIGQYTEVYGEDEKSGPTQREILESTLKQGEWKGVVTNYDAEGKPILMELYTWVVLNERNEKTGLCGIARDITERKQAEEERKKLEAQLQQAQKMEAIGTLAGGVAHDFNNILMGIQGHVSLMSLDTNSDNPHFEHHRGIEKLVTRAAELTRQLLGFARGGKYEVKPTDLNELIKRSSQMFGRTKKEITIHRKYQKGIWTVEADQGQIEQVLLNLYVNAWQAMPQGGEIYLQTENVTLDENYVKPFKIEPGGYVKILVADTGIGMDEETPKRIFEPFFTTKEMGKGTGLGLASAYGIIKNHGGFINVYSEKGKGTAFTIYLPASEKEAVKEKEIYEEVLKGTETVLLIDDEEMIIKVGQEVMKSMGYKVLVARSGKEAIEQYKENKDKIDMVILDMVMPDISGGRTYDQLKKINPDIKVLLSSGYSINGRATEILKRGCDAFIQKPFNMKQLSRKIREVLDKK